MPRTEVFQAVTNIPFTPRRAAAVDVDTIAEVFSASLRLLVFLPNLHTVAEDRSFIANTILRDCEVIIAEDDSGIVSFLARQGEEIRLLYTRPDGIGCGAGTQLIEAAKKKRGRCSRTLVLSGQRPRTAVLRGARLSSNPLYVRRG